MSKCVLAGRNLAPKDPNGLSDPYCIIGLADDEGNFTNLLANVISEVKYWTLNPVWQEALFKDIEQGRTLRVEVWDRDSDKPDDFMGYVLFDTRKQEDRWIKLLPRDSKEAVSGEIHVQVIVDETTAILASPSSTADVGSVSTTDSDSVPTIGSDSVPTTVSDSVSTLTSGLAETLIQREIPKFAKFIKTQQPALDPLVEKFGKVVLHWLNISQALALPLPLPSETRGHSLAGLGKLCKGQWIDAFKFYSAQQDKAGRSDKLAFIMSRLHAPLGNAPTALLKELEDLDTASPTANVDSALQFITYACAYEKCIPKSATSHPNRLQAAAYALSFLASPPHWKEHLGGKLEELAWSILREYCSELSPLFGINSTLALSTVVPRVKPTIEDKWQKRKANSLNSPTLDKLLTMAGLDIFDHVTLDKERNIDISKKKYNVKFVGNPGTGKTTVAELYANLLSELGVIPNKIEETSGAALAEGGTQALTTAVGNLQRAGGGLLLVDRADALDPTEPGSQGKKVLEMLITLIDKPKCKMVTVFIGLPKPIEDLFVTNEGLPSRFPYTFVFPDFTDEQLFNIFCSLVQSENFSFANQDPKYARVLIHKLGKRRGTRGFGNARAVESALQEALKRQAARLVELKYSSELKSEMQRVLERDDILGPKPTDFTDTCSAWHDLEKMVGLVKVKSSLQELFSLVKNNQEQEEEENPTQQVALNRLFLGNPGTGKTTVASLYGRILKDLGLLSKGDVKLHKASDFVNSVVGGSEENTRRILKSAEGCVLVIDEAYGLFGGKQGNTDSYRVAVLNTLVEEIQNVPGEDRCVIMLGYEDQMREMIRESNPGLARRFQLDDAFIFEDYNNYELLQILDTRIMKDGVQTSQEARIAALNVLERQRNQPNFGNGGAVANLLSQAILRMRGRTKGQPRSKELLPIDFDPLYGQPSQDGDVFEGLIGCDNIVRTMQEYRATITMGLEKGLEPFENEKLELNFLFVGPPGTGKTTVARRLGKMFKSLGVLSSDEVTAISASDLETGFVGQSGKKTREILTSCIGRVLFIDEAYRLATDSFLQQATDELVQLLTEPKFKNRLVVVLAGYEHQMDNMLKLNPGLRSRFSSKIRFENFSNETCCALLKQQLKKDGLDLDGDAAASLPTLMPMLRSMEDFGNGRDIDTWAKRLYRTVAQRRYNTPDSPAMVLVEDLALSLNDLILDRKKAAVEENNSPSSNTQFATSSQNRSAPVSANKKVQKKQEGGNPGGGGNDDNLSPLSSGEWDSLSDAISKLGRSLDKEGIKALAKDSFLQYQLAKTYGSVTAVNKIFHRALNELENQLPVEEEDVQKILADLGKCSAGYKWRKVDGGYRCEGGSHYMSSDEVNQHRKR